MSICIKKNNYNNIEIVASLYDDRDIDGFNKNLEAYKKGTLEKGKNILLELPPLDTDDRTWFMRVDRLNYDKLLGHLRQEFDKTIKIEEMLEKKFGSPFLTVKFERYCKSIGMKFITYWEYR